MMRLLLKLAGVFFFTLFFSACNRTVEDAANAVQKDLSTGEESAAEAVQKPESLEDRRILRQQLADQQAKKTAELETLQSEEVDAVKGEVPIEVFEEIINEVMVTTGASRDAIQVLRSESLTFNDGSLGCGTPGQDYMQVQIPGYRIVLMHGRERFDYRVTAKGFSMLCKQPSPPDPRAGSNSPIM